MLAFSRHAHFFLLLEKQTTNIDESGWISLYSYCRVHLPEIVPVDFMEH